MRKGLFLAVVVGICFVGLALPPFRPDIKAEVTYVFDGDTIEVRLLSVPEKYAPALQPNQVVRVRYIAVDAPELNQPYGPQAAELNRLLVEGKTVYLELDVNWFDRYDRLLAYVYLDPDGLLMVNAMLIATPIVKATFYGERRYEEYLRKVDGQCEPPPCDCYGPDLDCSHFTRWVDAQLCYTYCLKVRGYDVFRLDADNDGLACERLPR